MKYLTFIFLAGLILLVVSCGPSLEEELATAPAAAVEVTEELAAAAQKAAGAAVTAAQPTKYAYPNFAADGSRPEGFGNRSHRL